VSRVLTAVSEDNGVNGRHLRVVLAAATLCHRPRRPETDHLAVRAHPAGLDRVSLAGTEQLLLEPTRLLLDQRHSACWLQVRAECVVSVCASARHATYDTPSTGCLRHSVSQDQRHCRENSSPKWSVMRPERDVKLYSLTHSVCPKLWSQMETWDCPIFVPTACSLLATNFLKDTSPK